jgi:hypothetical protein
MVQRFQFPLTDRDQYNAKVTFQAIETIPPSIRLRGSNEIDDSTLKEEDQSALNVVKSAFSSDQKGEVVEFTSEKKKFLDKCSLFLPQGITFQDGVVFDEFSLGRVGSATEAAIQNGSSIAGAVGAGLQQNLNAITDVFNASPTSDVARLAAVSGAKLGGARTGGGVQSALRVSANPNKRLLFKEVNIREFSFNFKLIPTSKDEADEITKIIKFFRTELYPDDSIRVNSGGTSIPIGYKFPNQFEIIFKHKDTRIAHKILPAYLVSMNTTYNPTGMGFFDDGNFTETEVTLNFRESRTLSKNDVRSGGY